MAIYPGGKFRNIRPGVSDPPIIVIGAILHVDAGNNGSLFSYFNGPSGGIESHFHVRKDGVVEQYRDTGYEADANLKANSFLSGGKRYGYISIETQGYAAGEWNDNQLREIKELLVWLSKTHKFPLQKCPAHTEPGVGYHIMFGAPGPWTPVAKSCPGPDRIKQFNNILVPWFKTALTPKPTPVVEDDMPYTEAQLRAMMQAEEEEYAVRFWVSPTGTGTALINLVKEMKLQLDRIEDDTDQATASRQLVAKLDENVSTLAARPIQTAQGKGV